VLEHNGHPNCRWDAVCSDSAKCSNLDIELSTVEACSDEDFENGDCGVARFDSWQGGGGRAQNRRCNSTNDILENELFPLTPEPCCDVHVRQSVMMVIVGDGTPQTTFSFTPERQVGMMRGEEQLRVHAWTGLADVEYTGTKNFFLQATGDNGFDSING
jgi:hypothetical protein